MVATDDFNRGALGTDWTGTAGAVGSIFSNQVYMATPGVMYWSANTFGSDHYAQLTMGAVAPYFAGPAVRVQPSGACYFLYNSILYYNDTATSHVIGSFGFGVATGDVIRMEAEGTTIRVFVNGNQEISVTHSILSGGAPGLSILSSSVTADDWSGGDLAVGPADQAATLDTIAATSLLSAPGVLGGFIPLIPIRAPLLRPARFAPGITR
jgi:hypothetical protein